MELLIYVLKVEEFNPIVFTVASVLMMLMRNNGIYAYVAAMVVIIICELVRCYERKKIIENKNTSADGKTSEKNSRRLLTHTAKGRVYKMLILTLLSVIL